MKKVIGIALGLLLVISVVGVWAGEIEGKIQSVDPSDRMFTLEDGTHLWVDEGLSVESLKEGATVKATYEERDGKKVVTNLEVSQ